MERSGPENSSLFVWFLASFHVLYILVFSVPTIRAV